MKKVRTRRPTFNVILIAVHPFIPPHPGLRAFHPHRHPSPPPCRLRNRSCVHLYDSETATPRHPTGGQKSYPRCVPLTPSPQSRFPWFSPPPLPSSSTATRLLLLGAHYFVLLRIDRDRRVHLPKAGSVLLSQSQKCACGLAPRVLQCHF